MRQLQPAEWYNLKALVGQMYRYVVKDEPVPDYLYNAVLDMIGWERSTVVDAVLFGSIQLKLISTKETLLYNDSDEIEKRQIYVYDTPDKHKIYHPKN